MKAILLAAAMTVLFLGVMTAMLRRPSRSGRTRRLTRLWLGSVPLLALTYWLTPADLGLLPASLLDDPPWFGPLFCLGIWSVGYFGGLLQLYNLADRGLSLRLLIHTATAPERGDDSDGRPGICLDRLLAGESDDSPGGWILDRRLHELQAAGLVEVAGKTVSIRPAARRAARWLGRLRSWMGLRSWT